MSSKYRKKKSLFERPVASRSQRFIVIATEGKETERQYFEMIRDLVGGGRVELEILNTSEAEGSSPKFILARLKEKLSEDPKYNPKYDEFWLAFDTDTWTPKEMQQVIREAIQQKYKLAISKPHFETWRLLHFITSAEFKKMVDAFHKEIDEEIAQTGKEIDNKSKINRLKKRIEAEIKTKGRGCGKNINRKKYKPKINDAIKHAKALDKPHATPWPKTPGSRVYLLVESCFSQMPKP